MSYIFLNQEISVFILVCPVIFHTFSIVTSYVMCNILRAENYFVMIRERERERERDLVKFDIQAKIRPIRQCAVLD